MMNIGSIARTRAAAALGAVLLTVGGATGCADAFGGQQPGSDGVSGDSQTGAGAPDRGAPDAEDRSRAPEPRVVASGESVERLGMLMVAEAPGVGPYLIDENGRTLYVFDEDSVDASTSACLDECALTWPPVPPEREVAAHDGVDASLVATIEREDGSRQLTYAGRPLYRYAEDRAEGDLRGTGIEGWYAVAPDGTPLSR